MTCGHVEPDVGLDTCPVCGSDAGELMALADHWRVPAALVGQGNYPPDQRTYARRFFNAVCMDRIQLDHLEPEQVDCSSWLLRDVVSCTEVDLFNASVPAMASVWQLYQGIDTGNLSSEDQDFLRNIHNTYGQSPSLEELMQDALLSQWQDILFLAGILSEEHGYTDRQIVFINQMVKSE
jgi:hypothetical protein